MSAPGTTRSEFVGIDILDAAEAGELCCWLAEWLRTAPAPVQESLRRFAGQQGPEIVVEALGRFAELFVRLLPSGGPVPTAQELPLKAGEAISLAALLQVLGECGWPAEVAEAEALTEDCRAWSARLMMVPGVVS